MTTWPQSESKTDCWFTNLSGFWKLIVVLAFVNGGIVLGLVLFPAQTSPLAAQTPAEQAAPSNPIAAMHQRAAGELSDSRGPSTKPGTVVNPPPAKNASTEKAAAAAVPAQPKAGPTDLPNEFRSDGISLARGVKFTMRYPTDWRQVPTDGPRAVAKFFSSGQESIVLFVMPMPIGKGPQDEALRQAVFEQLPKTCRMKYGRVSARDIQLAGQRGLAISHDFVDTKRSPTTYMRVCDYIIIGDHNMITLQCRVESTKKDAELDSRFERLTPLYDRVAQSLTLR